MFNVIEYLEDRNISYRTTGKNVSAGWVEVNCPWCGDPSEHLGINIEGLGFNCWSCGNKGYITKYIAEIENSISNIRNIINKFSDQDKEPEPLSSLSLQQKYLFKLPSNASDQPSKNHKRYLKKRNFDVGFLCSKYGIRFCSVVGKYKHSIIIPIIMNREMVSFTTRDVTGMRDQRYSHCPNNRSIIPIKQTIYNLDNCNGETALILEGPTDVWRMGDNTMALFGTQYTQQQIALLSQKKFKRLYILFDKKAGEEALMLAKDLSLFVTETFVVDPMGYDYDDPASLTQADVLYVKKNLVGV